MNFARFIAAAFLLSAFSTTIAAADQETWRAATVAGSVIASAPLSPAHAIKSGEIFASGTVITTGVDGQLVFGDGKTVITMSANSRLTTPAEPSDAMTRFVEDLGSVFFKVEKRPLQHFEVQTPLIAAVVKGTQFTVAIDSAEHSVSVTEGLVEVLAMRGGAKEMVPAGHAASVRRVAPLSLRLAQSDSGAITRAIGDAPIDYAAATGGLVQTQKIPTIVALSQTNSPNPALSTTDSVQGNGQSGNGTSGNDNGNSGGNGNGNNGNANGNDGGNGNSGNGNSGGGNGNGNSGNGNGNGGGNGNSGNGNSGGGNGNGNGNGGGLPGGGGDGPGNGNGPGGGHGKGHGKGG